MMKTVFSFVAAAMLMAGCMGGVDEPSAPESVEGASQNVSQADDDLAELDGLDAKALQARYCRTGYRCCEPEIPGWDDGDANENECWICRPRNVPCP